MAIVDAKTLSLSPIQSKSSVAGFIDVTLMSNIHRKKKSESESSDWEDETFCRLNEQDEYLQETYGNELPKLRWVLHFAVKVRYLKILGWLWSWVPTSDGCHWVSSRQWLGQPSEYGVCIIHSLICVCWQLCTRCIVQTGHIFIISRRDCQSISCGSTGVWAQSHFGEEFNTDFDKEWCSYAMCDLWICAGIIHRWG